jgi:dipeptidyl aminopeptidase/acylaminoacyl peptidase
VKVEKEGTSIKPEDLFPLTFIQDAQLSPDGKTVAYTVSHVDMEEQQELSAIWLLSLETGEERQLTAGLGRDVDP